MITKLTQEHVKGLSCSLDLENLTAITGPNFSGKTSIATAVRLALLGYDPVLGKSAPKTFQLASDQFMRVGAELLDRHGKQLSIERSWTMNRGSVKTTAGGDTVEWPTHILDVGVFLGASKKDKVKMILASAPPPDDLAAVVAEKAGITGMDSLEKLEAKIDELSVVAKSQKQDLKTFEGTLKGTTAIDAQADVVRYDPDAIAGCRVVQQNVSNAVAEAKARLSALEQADQRADEAASELEDYPVVDLDATTNEIAGLTASLAQHTGNLRDSRALVDSLHEARNQLTRRIQDASRKISLDGKGKTEVQLREELDELMRVKPMTEDELKDEATWKEERDARKAQLPVQKRNLEMAREKIGDFAKQILELEAKVCCPTCKAAGPDWRKNVMGFLEEQAALANADKEEWETAVAESEGILKTAEEHVALYEIRRANLMALDWTHELLRLHGELDALQNQRNELEAKDGLRSASERLAELEEFDDTATRTKIEALRRLLDTGRNRPALEAAVKLRPTQEDLQAANDVLAIHLQNATTAQEAMDRLLEQKTLHDQEAERARNIKESRDRVDKLKVDIEKGAEVLGILTEILAEQSKALWGPINEISAVFATTMKLKSNIGMSEGEIGAWHGSTFAPFDVLSGTEQLVAAAAIQIGLSGTAPSRILILDEMSRMTPETKKGFATAVEVLRTGRKIDQAILIDHDSEFWNGRALWKTIDIAA